MKFLTFFIIIIFTTPTFAEPSKPIDPKKAKQYIAEILSQPEFKTTREESYWKYIGESSSEDTTTKADTTSAEPFKLPSMSFSFIGIIAELFELLLWILLGIGIILLIIHGSRWWKQVQKQPTIKQDYTATPRLLDKFVTNDFLPTDIPQRAWTLWQAGDVLVAISLLYRGALSVLITRDGLAINESATEKECLRLVRYKQHIELTAYFVNLSRAWQNIAYAGRQPNYITAQQLCEGWRQYFG